MSTAAGRGLSSTATRTARAARTRGTAVLSLLVLLAFPLSWSTATAHTVRGRTEVVPNPTGDMLVQAFSADGRYLVVENNEMAWRDARHGEVPPGNLWLFDRRPGPTVGGRAARAMELITLNADGDVMENTPGDLRSASAAISDDARFVAFESAAMNMAPNDTRNTLDIFLRDRRRGTTRLISVGDDQRTPAGGSDPAISPDGRYIVFHRGKQVYLRDMTKRGLELVSVTAAGTPADPRSGAPCLLSAPAVTTDGRFVAFASSAPNLVVGDSNGECDVFVRDRTRAVTEMVSVDSSERQGHGASTSPAISGDGRFVAFASDSSLVPAWHIRDAHGSSVNPNTASPTDVYVRDRRLGVTRRASVTSFGEGGSRGDALYVSMSRNGRYVVFSATAGEDFRGSPPSGGWQVFRHDVLTGATKMMSVTDIDTPGGGGSVGALPSGNGTMIAFWSDGGGFAATGESQGNTNAYVRIPGPEVGIVRVAARARGANTVVSGSVRTGGRRMGAKGDDPEDAGEGAYEAGGELTGLELWQRPEEGDVFARLRLAHLPAGGPSTGLAYVLSFRVGATTYQARLEQPGAAPSAVSPDRLGPTGYDVPLARLFRCSPACTEVRTIDGAVGATGIEALISIPTAALGNAARLTRVEAFTAQADGSQPLTVLDRVSLASARVDRVTVRAGIAGPRTRTNAVQLSPPLKLANGAFSMRVDRVEGARRVVAKLCYGRTCKLVSNVVRVERG